MSFGISRFGVLWFDVFLLYKNVQNIEIGGISALFLAYHLSMLRDFPFGIIFGVSSFGIPHGSEKNYLSINNLLKSFWYLLKKVTTTWMYYNLKSEK